MGRTLLAAVGLALLTTGCGNADPLAGRLVREPAQLLIESHFGLTCTEAQLTNERGVSLACSQNGTAPYHLAPVTAGFFDGSNRMDSIGIEYRALDRQVVSSFLEQFGFQPGDLEDMIRLNQAVSRGDYEIVPIGRTGKLVLR